MINKITLFIKVLLITSWLHLIHKLFTILKKIHQHFDFWFQTPRCLSPVLLNVQFGRFEKDPLWFLSWLTDLLLTLHRPSLRSLSIIRPWCYQLLILLYKSHHCSQKTFSSKRQDMRKLTRFMGQIFFDHVLRQW